MYLNAYPILLKKGGKIKSGATLNFEKKISHNKN